MVLRDVAACRTSEESRPPPNHETHGSLSGQSQGQCSYSWLSTDHT